MVLYLLIFVVLLPATNLADVPISDHYYILENKFKFKELISLNWLLGQFSLKVSMLVPLTAFLASRGFNMNAVLINIRK